MPLASPTEGGGGVVTPTGSGSGSSSIPTVGQSPSAMGDLLSGQVASQDALADQAYQNALANISTQRSQMLQQYGYNSDGTLDSKNPYGLYQQGERSFTRGQQDLTDAESRSNQGYGRQVAQSGRAEAQALDSSHSDALARGLHGGGVAGKAGAQARIDAALQRSGLAQQQQDATADFAKQQSDLTYGHGLGQYQLGMDMTNALSGFDQQKQQALFGKNQSYNDALMNEVMARLQNPDQFAGGS